MFRFFFFEIVKCANQVLICLLRYVLVDMFVSQSDKVDVCFKTMSHLLERINFSFFLWWRCLNIFDWHGGDPIQHPYYARIIGGRSLLTWFFQ